MIMVISYIIIGVIVGFILACVGKKDSQRTGEFCDFMYTWAWGIPLWPCSLFCIFYVMSKSMGGKG